MSSFLISIFNMSIAGGFVILLALIARFFMRNISKDFTYILWGVVCFRLICPVGINFQSIIDIVQGNSSGGFFSRTEYIPIELGAVLKDTESGPTGSIVIVLLFLFLVWFLGFAWLLTKEILAYCNAKKRLLTAIKISDHVFESDQIESAFIFGLIHPKIYVPVGITDKERHYMLCHESIHIQRKDFLIKFFQCFVLAIHWFNPFVWLAFKHMEIDMEMSCDERVIKLSGEKSRKEYAEIIFRFCTTKIRVTKAMLTFGTSNTRKRVSSILHKKDSTIIGLIFAVSVCVK